MHEVEGDNPGLFGRVVGEAGTPVAGASVAIVAGPRAAPDFAAITDGDGWFALGDVGEGRWTLRAYAQDGRVGEGATAVGDRCLIVVRRRAASHPCPQPDDSDLDRAMPSGSGSSPDCASPELSTPESD